MTTDNNNGHSTPPTWTDMPYPAPAPAAEPDAAPARPAEPQRAVPDPRPPTTNSTPHVDPQLSSYAPAEPMSAIPYAEQPTRIPLNEPPPMRIPTPGSIDASQTPSVRIGLWGSSRAGKSTYLAALPIAGLQTTSESGRWIVSGIGDDAQEYLVRGVENLAHKRQFPPPTHIQEALTWAFHGPPPRDRIKILRRERDDGPRFALQLQDVPGEFFRTGLLSSDAVDHFANSQGLVYLFDPVSDVSESLKSFDYFYAMLQAVLSRVRDAGRLVRNRLPHQVAVCITKFDDPGFLDAAVRAGWVIQQNSGSQLPMVRENQAEAFFDWVCRIYRGGTAAMINDALKGFFHPERVRYCATSAIGFRLNSNHIFDYNDFRNTESVNGKLCLRTTPRPMNVLEPLIDLERRISGRKR